MNYLFQFTIALVASGLIVNSSEAQMEIRGHHLYNAQTFQRMAPLVGESAPKLCVRTLSGDSVSLDSWLGKNIVVIKGSLT